jgi:methionyl-tRNA synthetase
MLKAHGNFVLPDNVPANEFLNLEGEKISTSRNWAVWVHEFVNDFPGCEDVLRYVLCSNAPETKDNDFTWKSFQEANNSELVNIFGNFVNRTFVLMHKLCNGKVPKFHNDIIDESDKTILEKIKKTKIRIEGFIEDYKFRDALFEVMDLARSGNKYLQEKEPWKKTQKTSPDDEMATEAQNQINNCIHVCLQLCANLAIYINPFLPTTAKKMCYMMKVVDKMLEWENAGKSKLLSVGYSLRPPELLFRKIQDEEIEKQMNKLKTASEEKIQPSVENQEINKNMEQNIDINNQIAGDIKTAKTDNQDKQFNNSDQTVEKSKPEITFDDFAKLDLRIGTITTAEKVEKADKLLRLEIDLGFEKRTIVSGIAQHFTPENLVNKQVIVVANLAPRKMRGIVSEGMILTAEEPDGKLILVNPDALTKNGSTVR